MDPQSRQMGCPRSGHIVPRRELASVVWQAKDHLVELPYVEGKPDFLEGDELLVSRMAQDEGMLLVPTAPGHPALG